MEYKPLFDKVLLEEFTPKEMTGSLIVTASGSGFKAGKVLAAGEGLPDQPMTVKVGQTVLFKAIDAMDITLDSKKYKLIQERFLWMIK